MSLRKLSIAWSMVALATVGGHAGTEVRTGSFADSLARIFSRDVREADARLTELDRELTKLPWLGGAYQSARYGFHSGSLVEQEKAQWVQIDLLDHYPVDSIALVAAEVVSPTTPGTGYGFPLRFKVEMANQADLSDAVVVVDRTGEDVPNPGRYPLVFEQSGRKARYVRVTSTRHWPGPDGSFLWALGEVMVISGQHNVAIHTPATSSGSMTLAPSWMLEAVNDGQSVLGLPESRVPSPTDGHRSSPAEIDTARRWLTIDFGKEKTLDEVRLIPAWPSGYGDKAGMGFPRALQVLLTNDPEFRQNVEQLNGELEPMNPGNNPYVIRVAQKKGRYLRVQAAQLWKRGVLRLMAFAEVQAFSGGTNVALGKKVSAADAEEGAEFVRWAPEFAVDGFSSQHELVPWLEYLRGLVERGELERERDGLSAARGGKARRVADSVILIGSTVGVVALLALGMVMVRHRVVRERDQALLREQIARDLHDELGSNLGSISLLSELGSRLADLPEEVRADFAEIHRTAERSAEAMRDIVWLVDSGSSTLRELVAKMREAAERLAGDKLQLKVAPEEVGDCVLSLHFRRHALFSFKEALNNVRRHAAAEVVSVLIDCSGGKLQFTIRDDGVGFRVDERFGLGHGLKNLVRRAQRLKGQCAIDSVPQGGTTVRFEAPLKSKPHGGQFGPQDPSLAG